MRLADAVYFYARVMLVLWLHSIQTLEVRMAAPGRFLPDSLYQARKIYRRLDKLHRNGI